jgi:hypothetical protein
VLFHFFISSPSPQEGGEGIKKCDIIYAPILYGLNVQSLAAVARGAWGNDRRRRGCVIISSLLPGGALQYNPGGSLVQGE